ncbi:MAG: hypothetical protein QOH73_384 [Gaiellaceae bacterium]|jgi:hypothetical protein|nr:hypothetical protein [Gaiellaceae bacterium]
MKRVVVLAVACLTVALVASGTAGARSTALTPAEKNLQKQLNAVSKDVTALKKQVTTLKKSVTDAEALGQAAVLLDECSNAVTADALQGTWTVIDQIATTAQAKTYFGAQTPVDDHGICALFGVTRSQVSPPTVAPFNSLIGLVGGASLLTKHVAL